MCLGPQHSFVTAPATPDMEAEVSEIQAFPCEPCNLAFASWKLLWNHKCHMRDSGRKDHKGCSFCDMEFEVARSEFLHVQREHEPDQELLCPGCGRGPFSRMGTLIAHVERGQCTRIRSTDIEKLRERKLDFHRELDKLADEPAKGNYANYLSEIRVEPWSDIVEVPSDEKPGQVTETSFPKLLKDKKEGKKTETQKALPVEQSRKKTITDKWSVPLAELKPRVNKTTAPIDLSPSKALADKWNNPVAMKGDYKERNAGKENVWWQDAIVQNDENAIQAKKVLEEPSPIKVGDAKWQGSWGSKDIQKALAKAQQPRITPTAEQLAAATTPAPKAPVDALDIDNPKHPHFNASKYLCTIIDKYICPKLRCGKYFKNKNGLLRHLTSPAHGDKSYQCPKCLHIFKSVTAVASHCESPGKCRIRETEHYGAFLDQITGGMIQVGDDPTGQSVKYNVQKDFVAKTDW